MGGIVWPKSSGLLGRLNRLGPAGPVFELRVDDLDTPDPSVECLELPVGGLDPDPLELSLSYPGLEVAWEYTDAMEGSGDIPVVGNCKGVYSNDVADGRRLCCVSIRSAEY